MDSAKKVLTDEDFKDSATVLTDDDFKEESPKVKLSFSEKIADLVSGGAISKGKQIQQEAIEGKQGEKAQILAKGLSGAQDVMKTTGQLGQAIILGKGAGTILQELPWLQKIKQATALTPASFAQRASTVAQNITRSSVKLAGEGAAAAQAFDYKDLQDRLTKTVGAAAGTVLIGGAINAGINTASSTWRIIKKIHSSIKDPRIPVMQRVKDSISQLSKKVSEIGQTANRQITTTSRAGSEVEKAINERVNVLTEAIKEETKLQSASVKNSLVNTTRQINKAVNNLDAKLSSETDIAAKTFQEKIGGFFRNNSASYGKELDVISEEIAKTGRMTRGEGLDVLTRALQRSKSEADVTNGSVLSKIEQLKAAKYDEQVTDAMGNIVIRDLNEQIPFSEFLKDVRSIWKSIKPYTRGARFSEEEIPAAILQSEFGEFVSGIPGGNSFRNLQAAYRLVISYMNRANSLIKPYKGEAYRDTAQRLITKYVEGKTSGAETDLIKFLEVGTKRFGDGIGNVTSRARQVADNAKTLKEQLARQGLEAERKLFEIAEQGAMKISRINAMGSSASKLVQEESQRRAAMILEEGAKQEMQLARRMQTLAGREKEVERLMAKRNTIKNLSAAIGLTISGVTGLYGLYRVAAGASRFENLPNP